LLIEFHVAVIFRNAGASLSADHGGMQRQESGDGDDLLASHRRHKNAIYVPIATPRHPASAVVSRYGIVFRAPIPFLLI
jgi:hypothetical protein